MAQEVFRLRPLGGAYGDAGTSSVAPLITFLFISSTWASRAAASSLDAFRVLYFWTAMVWSRISRSRMVLSVGGH